MRVRTERLRTDLIKKPCLEKLGHQHDLGWKRERGAIGAVVECVVLAAGIPCQPRHDPLQNLQGECWGYMLRVPLDACHYNKVGKQPNRYA